MFSNKGLKPRNQPKMLQFKSPGLSEDPFQENGNRNRIPTLLEKASDASFEDELGRILKNKKPVSWTEDVMNMLVRRLVLKPRLIVLREKEIIRKSCLSYGGKTSHAILAVDHWSRNVSEMKPERLRKFLPVICAVIVSQNAPKKFNRDARSITKTFVKNKKRLKHGHELIVMH